MKPIIASEGFLLSELCAQKKCKFGGWASQVYYLASRMGETIGKIKGIVAGHSAFQDEVGISFRGMEARRSRGYERDLLHTKQIDQHVTIFHGLDCSHTFLGSATSRLQDASHRPI